MNQNEKIFPPTEHSRAYHNPAALFVTAPDELRRRVQSHYSQRAGHIPPSASAGIIVSEPNPNTAKQIDYLSQVLKTNLSINTLSTAPTGSLIAPYVNTPETEKEITEHGHHVWGLPSKLVALAKNKANCHKELESADIPNFGVPEYTVTQPEEIRTQAFKLLKSSENLYQTFGMQNDYPLGLVFRGALSDGNYGAMTLRQSSPASIVCTPDGDLSRQTVYPNWVTALQTAQDHFPPDPQRPDIDRRVVISRFMDIYSSPGLSIFLNQGDYYSLGWNDQIQNPGSIACVGTSTYQASDNYRQRMQHLFEENSARNLFDFTSHLCHKLNLPIRQVTGFINVDLMLPGKLEMELQKRQGQKTHPYVAEINPRFTNWTDAIMLALWAEQLDVTVKNIYHVIATGMLTADKLPVNIDHHRLSQIHDTILDLDRKEQQRGNRVVLRMADMPNSGFLFLGNTAQVKDSTIQTLSAI